MELMLQVPSIDTILNVGAGWLSVIEEKESDIPCPCLVTQLHGTAKP